MDRKNERIAVVDLHKVGMKMADIVKLIDFNSASVYTTVKRFEETEEIKDRPRKVVHTRLLWKDPENPLPDLTNSKRSMRKMVIKLWISECSVRNTHKQTEASKLQDLSCTLSGQKHERRTIFRGYSNDLFNSCCLFLEGVFTDKKIITLEPRHSPQIKHQLLKKGQQKFASQKTI
ncbi:hypothetical protein KIN20_021279 [Parelaphostrongylus tenuis]|uniref:Uncharacterized protein n=1 Tax=Parelaphostrongylus tenuis TaxID=148309 RepID=A0AAD5QW29_PARTN|nr:hypothetical protein KIN20_021279 [Parelaphostrongylus tenuis]